MLRKPMSIKGLTVGRHLWKDRTKKYLLQPKPKGSMATFPFSVVKITRPKKGGKK